MVGVTYPSDQRAQVRVDLWPASTGAGFPLPISAEADPMPAHEGLRADNRDGLEDRRKPSIQLDEKQTVTILEAVLFVAVAGERSNRIPSLG